MAGGQERAAGRSYPPQHRQGFIWPIKGKGLQVTGLISSSQLWSDVGSDLYVRQWCGRCGRVDRAKVATYKGGVLGSSDGYDLDDHHHFTKGKPMLVCGNTASMVQETRLSKYFAVQGGPIVSL